MTVSPEQIQALSDAVSAWRMQEYLMIAFYMLYIYYVLTSFDEEVAISFPQKWGQGKMLYTAIRHGFIASISIQLARDFRNYYTISPTGCKVMLLAYYISRDLVFVACNAALGLCLGALLRLPKRYLAPLLLLCVGPTTVSFAFDIGAVAQYPIPPSSPLDEALGYPCYYLSDEEANETTITSLGLVPRRYLQLAITLLLVLLGLVTLFTQYKGRSGRLIQVIRRDGGIYYITLLLFRLASALISTPAIAAAYALQDNFGVVLFGMMNISIPPILAQRLLINMRNIDYMGTEPAASRLLFAPPASGTDDSFDEDFRGSLEMVDVPSEARRGATQGTNFMGVRGEIEATSNA